MSSNIIDPLPKDSVSLSDKLEHFKISMDDIEAPKDSVLKRMAPGKGLYAQVVMIC